MLKQRVITALILAPLVVGAVYLMTVAQFAVMVALVLCLAVYEWAGFFFSAREYIAKGAYCLLFLAGTYVLWNTPEWLAGYLLVACVVWFLAFCAVLAFPRGKGLFQSQLLLVPLGLALPLFAWLAATHIHAMYQGPHWILWLLILVWGADIGAYFAGRAFGERKLAPQVSPGKTWAGVGGGLLLGGGVCAIALSVWQGFSLAGLALVAGLVMVSVFGDLFESLLKRATDRKDSGNLLPGHGGMLDRLDSVMAVLPILGFLLLTSEN